MKSISDFSAVSTHKTYLLCETKHKYEAEMAVVFKQNARVESISDVFAVIAHEKTTL